MLVLKNRNLQILLNIFKIFRVLKLFTNLVRWRFAFRQNRLIFPLFIQITVLLKIGFTKEFIYALFHALTEEEPNHQLKSDGSNEDSSIENTSNENNEEVDISNVNNEQDISNENTNTEEIDEYPKGNSCLVCKEGYETTLFWCKVCDSKSLQDDFPNWSSGNQELDQIIRNTQLNADGHINYLEWIPYEKFTDIKKICEGGFGIVYSATWMEGPRWKWDDEKMQWVASGPRKIAFKTLKRAKMIRRRKEFLKELENHSICVSVKRIVHCFGVTRHPDTGNYMMVTNFANAGDLTSYIRKHHQKLTWERVIRLSLDIAKALRELHRKGLIHCDLHSGNILNHVTIYGITWTWIADLGLCLRENEANQTKGEVYGKYGYIAPEVLNQKPYTKAADVYSFGIILWELTSCRMPFSNERQDSLCLDIINGRRPDIVEGTPPALATLIQDCWKVKPEERPTMENIYKRIWSFSNSMNKGNRKDRYGFKAAEKNRSLSLLAISDQIYPEVIHSQILQLPIHDSKFIHDDLSSRIIIDPSIPLSIVRSLMNSCRIKDSTNKFKKESKATDNQKLLIKDSEHGMEIVAEENGVLSLPLVVISFS
ncbi:kinase-like domain-containing protein [Glomus cerebriforme]|uniref:Kinase-like domain-containing protein n=1 Tax=Glomus cerebriforme TaxID=658196 RepID=A0A397T3J8_9GLOM|nr:kinase-like domain-containing protein [Glomus cerebriforme]